MTTSRRRLSFSFASVIMTICIVIMQCTEKCRRGTVVQKVMSRVCSYSHAVGAPDIAHNDASANDCSQPLAPAALIVSRTVITPSLTSFDLISVTVQCRFMSIQCRTWMAYDGPLTANMTSLACARFPRTRGRNMDSAAVRCINNSPENILLCLRKKNVKLICDCDYVSNCH